ncbi:MAG: ATP-binding cassette domain-containing protein [Marinifilaceae bacterium]
MNVIVDNLSKSFSKVKAVDAISFEAKTGQVIGLLGPNGAGKTTTMRMISCYLFPDSGTIQVGKYWSHKDMRKIKGRIGYLPEYNPLYEEMNVVDFLLFIAKINNIPSYMITARVMDMIRLCGLEDEKHKFIRELSKGYRQRIGLAQALIHDPDVLLLDEPTTGLDPNQITEIRELISHISSDKTIIISSHILADIENTCNRVLIMNRGKIVADGTTTELRRLNGSDKLLKLTLGPNGDIRTLEEELMQLAPIKHALQISSHSMEIQCPADYNIEEMVFNICQQKQWYIKELSPIEAQLEDIFKQVTQN